MASPEDDNGIAAQLAQLSVKESPYEYRIVIGIDFAMTLSSVSYVCQSIEDGEFFNEGPIETMDQWPGEFAPPVSIPIPTRVGYVQSGSGQVFFGFEAISRKSNATTTVNHFKSSLHESPETSITNAKIEEVANGLGKKSYDFTVDYLRRLKVYILQHLTGKFGEEIISSAKVEFVIGVPPVFSSAEQHNLKKLCIKAGFRVDQLAQGSEVEAVLKAGVEAKRVKMPVSGIVLYFQFALTVPKECIGT